MGDIQVLLRELVAVNSVNPGLAADGPGETAIARLLQDWCHQRDIATHWIEPVAGRPSVVAVVRGSGGGRSLMINAHLDTVGVAGMQAPFEPRSDGGRLYGRGALDMKAGLAAGMKALERARSLDLRGDVLLAAVADEEHESLGTRAVLERFTADAAVLTEPTDLDLHVAHRGFAVFEVETRGRASHTSQPHLGVNAVTHMGRVLAGIEALDSELRAAPPHSLLGSGSAQAVLVNGGEELFTTPSLCRLSYERRTLPGESREAIEGELARLLERAALGLPEFRSSSRLIVHREPFEIDPDAELVRRAIAAVASRRGTPPRSLGAPYWTDAALLHGAGIPTVIFGPAGGGLHAVDEWVDLSSVELCSAVLADIIKGFCA